ncbi:HIT-like protein, partial [Aureobasidium melanogenum]
MGAPQEAITEDEIVGMELPDTKPNSKNAFTELMSKKPINPQTSPEKSGKHSSSDKAKPKWSFDGRDGLGVYTVDPDAYDRVLFNNEHAVIIKDMFPKSSVHLLVLPKSDRNLLHPFKAFEDPQLLADIKVEVERAKQMVASELRRKYGQFSKSEQARIQARDADDPPEVLPEGRDWMKEIITGVHAVPSMNHLHVHVMSRDMTSFLVPLEKFPLANDDPVRRIGHGPCSPELDGATIKKLAEDHENIKGFDASKATFYDNVMQHLLHLTDALALERAQRARLDQQFASLRLHVRHNSSSTEQSSYVLALIDGNELIFHTSFLGQGDQGGRHAAKVLFQTINEYAFSTIDSLSIHNKVIVRVYVDLEELCSLCLRAGLVDHSSQVRLFVRGFCQDKNLFDLIDVGMKGREVVIDKMEDNLHMNIVDTHCKHILFGCEDGEIYAPMLKRLLAENVETRSRITLLHGTRLDNRLVSLQLAATQMSRVFRDTRVDTPKMVDPIPELSFIPTLLRESVSPPLSSSSPATSHSSFRATTTVVHPAVRELHSRQVSASSNQSVEMSATPVTSWAMAAKKGAAVKAPPRSSIKEREPSTDGIRRNRKGQRIDPPTPEFKKDEVNRLKKLKLCNAHHLRHNCPYPDGKCEHDHLYKCNAKELETLKLVARMSACIHGSECSDAGCIYGHRCPFPESRESGSKGKPCINGENCRFPPEMHNMDITAVRRLKIT